MARDLPFDFSLPGPLRYAAFDQLGLFLAVVLAGKSTVYVHSKLEEGWETLGTQLLGHSGCVVKLTWAHPDHGAMLASASEDCTVKVWECGAGKSVWRLQTTLTLHRERPVDVQFLNDRQRLMLACGTVSGEVVIYNCSDVSRVEWHVASSFRLADLTTLCWGPNYSDLHLAVASRTKIQVWRYTDHWSVLTTCPASPSPTAIAWGQIAGRKSTSLAIGFTTGKVDIYTSPLESIDLTPENLYSLDMDSSAVLRLDWDGLGTYLSITWSSGRVDVQKRTLARTWGSVAHRR